VTQGNGSLGTPLPVRPRPRQGETADSYLRRLAAANHMRFSYLRRYLATPSGSFGPINAAQLAVLAGRKSHAILRAFPELGPAALRHAKTGHRYTREEIQHAYAAKHERYAVIRHDFDAGMSERAIERKHHVGRRTIIKALESADPPARKKIHREPAALNGLHGRIDAMMQADPAIGTATIWQRLADDHGVTVAYPTLRTYVTGRRGPLQSPPT
jgi:transposase